MGESNDALALLVYGFTARHFSDDCASGAVTFIQKSVGDIQHNVSKIEGNNESTVEFAKNAVEEWVKKCQESFKKLEIEAHKVFHVNEIKTYHDEEIDQLKKETDELFDKYIREKLFVSKLRAVRKRTQSSLKAYNDKTVILENAERKQDELQKYINHHANRLDQANLGNRCEKFSSRF